MKWFLSLIAIVVVIGFILFQRNSVKSSFVNGLPEYSRLPNQEYILERDCYVFKFKDHDTSWPLIGANAPSLAINVPSLPAEVTEKNIGADYPNLRILDVVRSGARFKIVSVRRDQSRKGTSITFEILLLDEAERHYPRLDAFWIIDHAAEKAGTAPSVVQDYAVLRVKK
jgi:hypothetical protein